MTTFERLKNTAKQKGYSLKTLAVKAGLSENALYRYNQGVEPKYGTLKAVADVLGVSVEYLLGNTEDTIPSTSNNTQHPVDLTEVADNENWDEWLTSNGRPLTDHDKKVLSALFGSE